MPNGQTDMGPGWTTDEFGNPVYDPNTPDAPAYPEQDFTGTLHSLGIGDMFEGSTLETDWSKYFEHYDPTREQMFTRQATTDIGQLVKDWELKKGQLTGAWELKQEELGEDWGGRKESLGAEAGSAYKQAFGLGRQAGRKSGMSFSGGVAEMERQQRGEITGGYKRAFGLGKTAYDQAMASGGLGYQQAIDTGQLGFEQGKTDIYQGLESDIFGIRSAWEQRQKDLATTLMQDDIWDVEQTTDQPWQSGVPPGVNAGDTQPVPGQGYPDSTDPNRTWYWNESEGWYTVGSEGESLNIYQTLCFTGDTRIITINGPKIIESVNSGDIVMTFDLKKNKLKKSKVTKTFKHKNPDGYIVINDILKTTPNHPFYSNGEWKEAGKLLIGDKILHIDGVEHKVKSIDVVDKSLDVYNIEVDGTHNYFAEGYLVHNK
jgi:hypothetical protein